MDTTEILIEKARSLASLNRMEQAVIELEKVLLQEPDNIDALMLITGCYLELENTEKSDIYSGKLLQLAPDWSISHYYRALYFGTTKQLEQAEISIREAIQLDPYDADYFGFLAGIYIQHKRWDEALSYADQGLAIDPENRICLNHRTLCLTKLNRKAELFSSIEDTLQANPHDAYTHANVGWVKLEKGDFKEAKQHFAESLRLNPHSEHARLGMIEAIKARNILYRWFLQYSFWMAKNQSKTQWVVILLIFFGSRVLRTIARVYPIVYPVYFLLLFFIYLTWIINPLGNIFLRFDPLGKFALQKDEKLAADIVLYGMIGGFASLILSFTLSEAFFIATVYCFTVIIPLSRYYDSEPQSRNKIITYLTFGLAIIGLGAVVATFLDFGDGLGILYGGYMIGLVAFLWISNISRA